MITITLSFVQLIAIAGMFFLSGKALQNGGVLYARGEDWHSWTLLGLFLYFAPIMVVGITAISQMEPTQ